MTHDDQKHERWFWIMTIVGCVFWLLIVHVLNTKGSR